MFLSVAIESNEDTGDSSFWSKYFRVAGIVIGTILVVLVIVNVWNGDDGTSGEGTIIP